MLNSKQLPYMRPMASLMMETKTSFLYSCKGLSGPLQEIESGGCILELIVTLPPMALLGTSHGLYWMAFQMCLEVGGGALLEAWSLEHGSMNSGKLKMSLYVCIYICTCYIIIYIYILYTYIYIYIIFIRA